MTSAPPACLPAPAGDEVKSLMWQLLVTLKYLHSLHVWHRDMKSQASGSAGFLPAACAPSCYVLGVCAARLCAPAWCRLAFHCLLLPACLHTCLPASLPQSLWPPANPGLLLCSCSCSYLPLQNVFLVREHGERVIKVRVQPYPTQTNSA